MRLSLLLFVAVFALTSCGLESAPTSTSTSTTDTSKAQEINTVESVSNNPLQLATDLQVSASPDVSHIVERLDGRVVETQWSQTRFATSGLIAHTEQRAGDASKGRQALLEEAYVSCGLPERVFRRLLADNPVTQVVGRTPKADGLPYSTNVSVNEFGVSTVSNNCLTCHGATLFGELVIGLGNEFQDFTNDSSALVERAGFLVRGEAETLSWELYADRVAAIAPYSRMHTVGVNPANNLTFALIAHRDAKTNAWSDIPLLAMPPTDPPPVSVPPWWRMSKKPAMFWLGEGRGDHARIMMAASMMCSDDVQALEQIDAYAPDIRAYIASLKPPAWPFPINSMLADKGQIVFEQTCAGCHGTYAQQPQYPARLVPIEVVQTDSRLVDFALESGAPYIDWFNRSFFGEIALAAPGPGYVAPPLDGIWATAPFLHNGSVPSLRAVLDSSTRPALWTHQVQSADNKNDYDQSDVGWRFTQLQPADVVTPKPIEIYDTRLSGYSNKGHIFGDHLTDDARTAVLEYLKTL